MSINSPQSTTQSPQVHHEKPSKKHCGKSQTPAKTPLRRAKKINTQKSTATPSTMAQ
jgi:hypothetical protein